jgi:hypothetical protein
MTDNVINRHEWRKLKTRFKDDCRRRRAQCWLGRHAIDYDAPPGSPNAFEADHYHPRSTHPHLALDYGNLRPCCVAHNRARRSDPVGGGEWVRPLW